MVDEVCDNLIVNKNSNMLGDLNVKGVAYLGTGLNINGPDLILDCLDRRKGTDPNTPRRALVHNGNDILTINWAGDYTGGVAINGNILATNDLNVNEGIFTTGLNINGPDLILDCLDRRKGTDPNTPRRALVHNGNDILTINWAGDYTGGVAINGNILATNNLEVSGKVDIGGDIKVTGDIILTNADCAEDFDIIGAESIEPGTVMVIDNEGALRASEQAYDRCVAGVISGAGDLRPGITLDRQNTKTNRLPIALTGKVYCKVDAEYGPVEIGDLLTTSPTIGHAMKADDRDKSFGAVIGKALHGLENGKGLIPVLVALQ